MSIRRIGKSGKYMVRVNITLSPGNYKRINKKADSYKEAVKIEKKLELFKKINGTMLFKDAVELFLDDYEKRRKKSSYEVTKSLINTRILPYFGDYPLDKITPSAIHTWQIGLLNSNLSSYYILVMEAQLKNIFKYAVKYLNLSYSPSERIKNVGKAETREMNYWTVDEFKKVLAIIPDGHIVEEEFKMILSIAFLCGLRMGEILALQEGDIDFSQETISVSKNFAILSTGPYISTPKTRNAIRVIHMPSFLAAKLQEHMQKQHCNGTEERIFKDYEPHKLRSKLKYYALQAGVKIIRFHELRHSAVSYWIHLGIPIFDISKRCGHASPKITYKIYAHMYPKEDDYIVDLLQQNKEQWDKQS